MNPAAILWRWSAEERAMRPLSNRMPDLEDGHCYRMEPVEDRSWQSHRHYFARIAELWANLPERVSEEPWALTSEFTRHWALIHEGYCHCQAYPCGSAAEARRWLALLPRPKGEHGQPVFSIRKIEGTTLYEFTPESQSMRAMGKERFQQSKTQVLDFIESLVGNAHA